MTRTNNQNANVDINLEPHVLNEQQAIKSIGVPRSGSERVHNQQRAMNERAAAQYTQHE